MKLLPRLRPIDDGDDIDAMNDDTALRGESPSVTPEPKATPAIRRARRNWSLRGAMPTLAVGGGMLAAALAIVIDGIPWWGSLIIGVVWAAVVLIARHGRTLAEWIADRWRLFRRNRRDPMPAELPGHVIDVDGVGVRQDGLTLISVIELATDMAETRNEGGRAITDSTVPLDLLATMMTQYDLHVGIDVVSAGRRVPPGPIRASYSQATRFYAGVAERTTWLVLRLDMMSNRVGISRRGPSRTHGPVTLKNATLRLEQRLGERRIRARAISGDELEQLDRKLLPDLEHVEPQETWRSVSVGETFCTGHILDPRLLTTKVLDRLWSVDSHSTAVVLQMRKDDAAAPARVAGLVRYDTDTDGVHDDEALWRRTGIQRELFFAALPVRERELRLPDVALNELASIEVPIGPAGALLGIDAEGAAITLPFHDATGVPQARQIEACVDLPIAQVMLLRAIGSGASVEVHTSRPDSWAAFDRTLADRKFTIVAPGAPPTADIAVYDGLPIDVLPPRTTMTLLPRGAQPTMATSGSSAAIIEVGPAILDILITGRKPIREVALHPTNEELRYTEVAAASTTAPPAAPVRRASAPDTRRSARAPSDDDLQLPTSEPPRRRTPPRRERNGPSVAARMARGPERGDQTPVPPRRPSVPVVRRMMQPDDQPQQPQSDVSPPKNTQAPQPPAAPLRGGAPADPVRVEQHPVAGPTPSSSSGRHHRDTSPTSPPPRPPVLPSDDEVRAALAARRARIRGELPSEDGQRRASEARRRRPDLDPPTRFPRRSSEDAGSGHDEQHRRRRPHTPLNDASNE